jgi:hypothetical protein
MADLRDRLGVSHVPHASHPAGPAEAIKSVGAVGYRARGEIVRDRGVTEMSDLTDLVERVRAGDGAGAAMVQAFRTTVVLAALGRDGRVAAADAGGIRWVFAFTSPAELAAWTLARGGDGDTALEYVTILGRRLLTVAPAGAARPVGVALDVAGGRPMLLPPMRGIVPGEFALDA